MRTAVLNRRTPIVTPGRAEVSPTARTGATMSRSSRSIVVPTPSQCTRKIATE